MTLPEVLVAYSNVEGRRELMNILAECELRIALAESVAEAVSLISRHPVHLGFCEECLPEGGCRELLLTAAKMDFPMPFVVCGAPERYVAAMWAGAFDYVSPPYSQAAIRLILKRRREPRKQLRLPVDIFGVDANGIPFSQSVWTRNVSKRGALIEGISCQLQTGAVVGIRCHDRQATFRVVWTSEISEVRAYEIGVENIEIGTPLWDLPLETCAADDEPCEVTART
jgi:hypothetical protein